MGEVSSYLEEESRRRGLHTDRDLLLLFFLLTLLAREDASASQPAQEQLTASKLGTEGRLPATKLRTEGWLSASKLATEGRLHASKLGTEGRLPASQLTEKVAQQSTSKLIGKPRISASEPGELSSKQFLC